MIRQKVFMKECMANSVILLRKMRKICNAYPFDDVLELHYILEEM